MRIGGFQKLSLVDFPGMVAATVFTQGCNFRCGYCHNPELVLPHLFCEALPLEMILDHLKDRRGKLEGIVITGGEPTLQTGLVDFITQIKAMGFAVKLDTNGSQPEVLSTLIALKLLDFIAMDVKSSLEKYSQVTRVACNTAKIRESIHMIINSGISYQLRTTLVKEFCSPQDLGDMQSLLEIVDHYLLQPFALSPKLVDHQVNELSHYSSVEIEILKLKYDKGNLCTLRSKN